MVEVLVIVVAIGVGAFLKGVTGAGLPQVAIPVMAIFLGVERAVVVMTIPGVVSNAWLLWVYRHHLRAARDLPVLVATGIAGAVLGTSGLKALDPRWLSLTLAGVIVLYLVTRVLRADFAFAPRLTRYTSPPVGLAAGLLQGSTGISGPLLTTYLHGFRLAKQVYVVSIVTLFLVYGVAQAISLVAFGLYTPSRVGESLLALIPIVAVLPFGTRLAQRLSSERFDRLILVLLVVFAVRLVYDALAG